MVVVPERATGKGIKGIILYLERKLLMFTWTFTVSPGEGGEAAVVVFAVPVSGFTPGANTLTSILASLLSIALYKLLQVD